MRPVGLIVWQRVAVVALAAAAFLGGRCSVVDRDAGRGAALEAEAQLGQVTDSLKGQMIRVDTIVQRVLVEDRRLVAERDSLRMILAFADSVAADTAATIEELRGTLRVTVAQARDFEVAAVALQDSVRVLVSAHAIERLAMMRTLEVADLAIEAWKDVADRERQAKWRWAVVGSIVGAVATAGVGLALVLW